MVRRARINEVTWRSMAERCIRQGKDIEYIKRISKSYGASHKSLELWIIRVERENEPRTAEEWSQIIKDFKISGLDKKTFCLENYIKIKDLTNRLWEAKQNEQLAEEESREPEGETEEVEGEEGNQEKAQGVEEKREGIEHDCDGFTEEVQSDKPALTVLVEEGNTCYTIDLWKIGNISYLAKFLKDLRSDKKEDDCDGATQ